MWRGGARAPRLAHLTWLPTSVGCSKPGQITVACATRHLVSMMEPAASGTERQPSQRRARMDALGDEMKAFEDATCDAVVDLSSPCVIRLDGSSFSKYTKGFAKPYDLRLHRAMVATATDLLDRFSATTAYTESDEISLFFPPSDDLRVLVPFNGRVQKLVSIAAGYGSARFNAHMMKEEFDDSEAVLRARVERSGAHFDARAFSLPDIDRVGAYIRWRSRHDCLRNSISMLAQAHFPAKRLHRVDSRSMLQMLKEEAGVDWNDCPAFFKWGTYIKKEEYDKHAYNPKTKKEVIARRTRSVSRSFPCTDEIDGVFLLERYWIKSESGELTGSSRANSP